METADLYAVTTLSIELDARQGRLLLEDADVRAGVRRQLSGLAVDLPITDLVHGEGGSAETLTRMYELHARFRDLLPGRAPVGLPLPSFAPASDRSCSQSATTSYANIWGMAGS